LVCDFFMNELLFSEHALSEKTDHFSDEFFLMMRVASEVKDIT
jgi:hypothetical protein